jgi:hypothetical protein
MGVCCPPGCIPVKTVTRTGLPRGLPVATFRLRVDARPSGWSCRDASALVTSGVASDECRLVRSDAGVHVAKVVARDHWKARSKLASMTTACAINGCLESTIWRGRLVSQADLYPGVPSRSLLRARRWACPLCTSLTHSQPGLADGPTRGSLGPWPSRNASTYARSCSIRART